MQVQPYLMFDGRCEEAIEFYKKALGAKVEMMMRFKEAPDPKMSPPGAGEKIMHSSLKIGDTTVLASDGHCTGQASFKGFSLAITLPSAGEVERCFKALADGGKTDMPLAKTFWTSSFGMLTDKFGVSWMVMVDH